MPLVASARRPVGAGIGLALLMAGVPLRAFAASPSTLLATATDTAPSRVGARGGVAAVAMPSSLALRPWLLAQAPGQATLETVIVTEADDGRSFNLRRGEQLRVVLGDTAGTGYSWEIERVDRRLLRSEGRRTWQDPGPPPPPGFKGPAGLVGGPLQVSFLFRAVAAGETELVLRHWRPWEGPGSVDRRFRLRLRVAG